MHNINSEGVRAGQREHRSDLILEAVMHIGAVDVLIMRSSRPDHAQSTWHLISKFPALRKVHQVAYQHPPIFRERPVDDKQDLCIAPDWASYAIQFL